MLTLEGGIPHKTVLSGTVARTIREYPFHDKGPHARGREIDCHTADMRLPFLAAPRAPDSGTRTMSEPCLTSHRPLARIMEVK